MPESLIIELKRLAKDHHYLDLSEEVRSIVRKKWMQYTEPELFELKQLRKDISEELKKKTMRKITEEVNKELEKIKRDLKKEEFAE